MRSLEEKLIESQTYEKCSNHIENTRQHIGNMQRCNNYEIRVFVYKAIKIINLMKLFRIFDFRISRIDSFGSKRNRNIWKMVIAHTFVHLSKIW